MEEEPGLAQMEESDDCGTLDPGAGAGGISFTLTNPGSLSSPRACRLERWVLRRGGREARLGLGEVGG